MKYNTRIKQIRKSFLEYEASQHARETCPHHFRRSRTRKPATRNAKNSFFFFFNFFSRKIECSLYTRNPLDERLSILNMFRRASMSIERINDKDAKNCCRP